MLKKTMGFSATSAATAAEGEQSIMSWSPVPVTPPRPLDFALSPASLRAIASAEVAFDRLVDEHEVKERERQRDTARGDQVMLLLSPRLCAAVGVVDVASSSSC